VSKEQKKVNFRLWYKKPPFWGISMKPNPRDFSKKQMEQGSESHGLGLQILGIPYKPKTPPACGAICSWFFRGFKDRGGLRQGLSKVARKGCCHGPASRAGDPGSPRKAAGAEAAHRGLPTKARLPPQSLKPI